MNTKWVSPGIEKLADLNCISSTSIDYLQNNMAKKISISDKMSQLNYFTSLRDRIAHELDLEQSQIDTLSDVNKEMNTECSWDFLGSWNDDHAFQRFCSALAKATDLEQINLRFFAPSLKNTELFISAIRANPSVKINLFNCGEVLTDAMREIQKERPESINIKNLTHFQKVGSLAKPKPFLIEQEFRTLSLMAYNSH